MIIIIRRIHGLRLLLFVDSQSCLAPKYQVLDPSDNVVFLIEGPVCMCQGPCCTQDMDFNVSHFYISEFQIIYKFNNISIIRCNRCNRCNSDTVIAVAAANID